MELSSQASNIVFSVNYLAVTPLAEARLAPAKYDLYISQLVVQEASFGDAKAAADRLEVLREILFLQLTEERKRLAEQLVSNGAIPTNVVEDALHIAIATSNGMEYLLTWNCKPITTAVMPIKDRSDLPR